MRLAKLGAQGFTWLTACLTSDIGVEDATVDKKSDENQSPQTQESNDKTDANYKDAARSANNAFKGKLIYSKLTLLSLAYKLSQHPG